MAKINFVAKDGTRYSFISPVQVLEFVTSELAAWTWLVRFEGHAMVGAYMNGVIHPLRNAQTQLSQAPPDLESAKNNLQIYLDFTPQAHPKAALRGWIQKFSEAHPIRAAYALAYLLQDGGFIPPFPDNFGGQSDWVIGIAEAMAFQNSWKTGERASIAGEQAAQSSKDAAVALAEARDTQAEINELAENIKKTEEIREIERKASDAELVRKTEELVTEMGVKFNENSETLVKEWNRFTAEFTSQLALKAPAGYWKSKHRNHTKWVLWLGIALSISAAGGAWVLHEMAWEIFGPLRFNQIPSWFQVITFSLATLVYVLILRSTLRIMMSHIHLSLDSAERQTMIVSYLALVRRGGIKEESLDKILNSIFRPTGDGIVKDEGIPLSALAELFKKN
jgi:hypothetical protein